MLWIGKNCDGQCSKKCGIANDNEFKQIVERECQRCRRSGVVFSLVTLSVCCEQKARKWIRKVSGMLKGGIRCTDLLGWWDKESLCVLLPNTDKNGALVFAKALSEMILGGDESITCSVFTYPALWIGEDDGIPLSVGAATAGTIPIGAMREDEQEASNESSVYQPLGAST